jgi:hypothetical protein
MKTTLDSWDKDDKLVWKASVQHHLVFGKYYDDIKYIFEDYLPILMNHRFDLYLNGHEHVSGIVSYPYSNTPGELGSAKLIQSAF